jgi:capsular exopolysaccharide synthesis family protein
LRAAIALAPKADRYRALAVTSTIPAEGKSLVASNLSIVIAQTGLKTLLVDADLRRPSVHKVFRLQSPIGLSSYLTEKVRSVDECIHATEVPHLDVVCCGAVPSSPSELAGSKRMTQFLQEVRGRYDRVVLDCPPVSAVSDPLIIASLSDGVVFVTKFNKIRRDHARKTVQRIQNAGIHILGVVLNDIDFDGKDSYYYSYYYYQNRYYLSHYSQTNGEAEPQKAKA